MPCPACVRFSVALCLALCVAGCTTAPAVAPSTAEGSVIEGTITSIDTQPWTYDGNAVIRVDTANRGSVAVELPARWNLCKAAPVDVAALAVGTRVRATGAAGGQGGLVVCEDASHRLVPVE